MHYALSFFFSFDGIVVHIDRILIIGFVSIEKMSARVSRRDAIHAEKQAKSKKKSKTNFNRFFQNEHCSNNNKITTGEEDVSEPDPNAAAAASVPLDVTNSRNLSAEEMIVLINRLTTVVQTVSENLMDTSEKIRRHRTTPTLGVLEDTNVSEKELPLLVRFKTHEIKGRN